MRTKLNYVSAIGLFVIGLLVAGCVLRGPANHDQAVADPLSKPVTLVPPYTPAQPGDPTDRIAVQYAVIAIAEQVGLGYDWDTSYKNTDPICRRWIKPEIRGKPCRKALEMILGPLRLSYQLRSGKIVLVR